MMPRWECALARRPQAQEELSQWATITSGLVLPDQLGLEIVAVLGQAAEK